MERCLLATNLDPISAKALWKCTHRYSEVCLLDKLTVKINHNGLHVQLDCSLSHGVETVQG